MLNSKKEKKEKKERSLWSMYFDYYHNLDDNVLILKKQRS